jgi:hypothetical protein
MIIIIIPDLLKNESKQSKQMCTRVFFCFPFGKLHKNHASFLPSFLLYFLLLHVPWTPQEAKKRKNQFPPPLITGSNFFLCPSCCSDEEEKEVKNGSENAHILYTQQQPQQQIWLQIFLLYFKLLLHR